MHLQISALDVGGVDAVLVSQLYGRIHTWVDNDATGERLVGVERNFKALSQFLSHFGFHCRESSTVAAQRVSSRV